MQRLLRWLGYSSGCGMPLFRYGVMYSYFDGKEVNRIFDMCMRRDGVITSSEGDISDRRRERWAVWADTIKAIHTVDISTINLIGGPMVSGVRISGRMNE